MRLETAPFPCCALAFALLLPTACTRPTDPDPTMADVRDDAIDIHSFAQPGVARCTHLALDLDADFATRTLAGRAALDLERAPGAAELRLDTDGLAINRVEDGAGRGLAFELHDRDDVLGSMLSIALKPDTARVVVYYRTSPEAAALQWLAPEQTAGTDPYLFTQGQAILTRTWVPLQDSPAVRITYEARIVTPKGLRAVMSAEQLGEEDAGSGKSAWRFRMTHPIPSYLIALAIGRLDFRPLGVRTGVYADPADVDKDAWELADTERMVEAAEKLYGPYRWGRYDLLVLPPSFPFGGMENPCLTFATPTIIAGDRSLVALVAHELAHSWSGNLVTNATWQDFWLNEGFTVYFESRIMEELYGADYAAMLRVLGFQDLQSDLASFGADSKDTRLYTDLRGRNPDDAFSNIPYEKGALFLRMVEAAVGRPRFDAFLSDYFDRFAFQPMTTARFAAWLKQALFAGDAAGWAKLDVDAWLYASGLPANAPVPTSTRLARVEAERDRFASGTRAADLATKDWSTHEWLHFLRKLPEHLEPAQLDDLDATFGLSTTGNCEKRFEWLRVCIRNDRRAADAALEQFLTMQGRRKFLKPLYQDLAAKDWGRALARSIYAKARPMYHSVSSHTIDKILEQAGR